MTASRRRCATALVALAALLPGVLAGPVGAEEHHEHPDEGGQFTVTQAERAPALPRPERAALDEMSRGRPPTAAQVQRALDEMSDVGPMAERAGAGGNLLADARRAADRFAIASDARNRGFRLTSKWLPGIGAHWTRWAWAVEPFDAGRPAMLLYDGNGPDAKLVGLSYLVQSESEPRAFRSAGAVWHRHRGLCIVNGLLVAESLTRRRDCAGGDGWLLPGDDLWMLHVWVVPDAANPWGTFAPLNPSLCDAVRPCTEQPK